MDISLEIRQGRLKIGNSLWAIEFNNRMPIGIKEWVDELNSASQATLEHTVFPHRACEGYTEQQKLDAYERMAYGGTPHEIPEKDE